MAQFLRSKSNNPSQGFAAGGAQRDVTRYQETFQRPGSIFGPGYPLVPPSRQLIRGWDYPVSWNLVRSNLLLFGIATIVAVLSLKDAGVPSFLIE
jgi:hypothetical protein